MTKPKKLPPLEVHSGLFPNDCSLKGAYGEFSVTQAEEVIRRCEMHDRLVEAIERHVAGKHADGGASDLIAILKENQ